MITHCQMFVCQQFLTNNISSDTTGPLLIDLPRNVPWVVPFQKNSKNSIICRTLYAVASERDNLVECNSSYPLQKLVKLYCLVALYNTIQRTCLFSSPEHEVLKASYCDRLLSGGLHLLVNTLEATFCIQS